MGSVQYKMVLLFCMFCPRVSDPSNLLTFGRSRPYLSIAPYHSTGLRDLIKGGGPSQGHNCLSHIVHGGGVQSLFLLICCFMDADAFGDGFS